MSTETAIVIFCAAYALAFFGAAVVVRFFQ